MNIEQYKKYAHHIEAGKYVLEWLDTTLNNYLEDNSPSTEAVEHIIDYLAQTDKKVERMSYPQAHKLAEAWTKALQKKGADIEEKPEDTEVILDFDKILDESKGFKILRLIGENAYKREGFLMRHCVADYFGRDVEVYSLRDNKNMPHCTMEKDQQIKGKGNGDIHPKYVDYIVRFLEHMDMKVGDGEMKHLGYIVPQFLEHCTNTLYRDRYLLSTETPEYDDRIVIFEDWKKLCVYKGDKVRGYLGNLTSDEFKIFSKE